VEPNHSSVGFRVIHHGISTFRCGFTDFEARFDADADTIIGSVKVESVRAFPMLRERLSEPDFFDLADHPEMRFASSAIEFGLTYNNELPNGLLNLGSHVTIELALEFVRPDPAA
jgi:polyisoprenoid-binding protein YceI